MITIAIDFDGTIVEHNYPRVGKPVPGAVLWIKRWKKAGARLFLWTMRSDQGLHGPTLTEALDYLKSCGVVLDGANEDDEQKDWTMSPKLLAQIYVDDCAFGCPLTSRRPGQRQYVDWSVVGPAVLKKLTDAARVRKKIQKEMKESPGLFRVVTPRDGSAVARS